MRGSMRPRLTLTAVSWASAVGLVALVVGLLYFLTRETGATVAESARRQRETAMKRVSADVERYLAKSSAALGPLEQHFHAGDCPIGDPRAVESCLLTTVLADPDLEGVTFTHAVLEGADDDGSARLAAADRWQLQVFRASPSASAELCSRWVKAADGGFEALRACRPPHAALLEVTPRLEPGAPPDDPTDSFTFTTPASERLRGRVLPTDLSWPQEDQRSGLPEVERRVVVNSLQAVDGPKGDFLGVLKVGLTFGQLSEMVRTTRVNPDPDDGFHVFLCDGDGRLITGFDAKDVPIEEDDDLRVDNACAPAEVARAIGSGLLEQLSPEHPAVDGVVEQAGARYLVSFLALPGTQGWNVGVVGPEDFYRHALEIRQRRMLVASFAALALVLMLGLLSLRAVRRSLRTIEEQTGRISRFDFSGAQVKSAFADVRDALQSIERAKTAVRAMGKYVPLDLVRQLFQANAEPTPGGALREISLMFTDIEGFTTLVEKEPPDRLAGWLGQYLSTMTRAIHSTHGTVDKYIGDAVMALWNAPTEDEDHVLNACRAALRCAEETRRLYASAAWAGRPALVTRIGLHVAQVMVGHFGAPDRLSYTAIGDGVNLASRLEGLNKEYGTRVLASEAVVRRAKGRFTFRRVDRVAVKGKAEAIEVYELLGEGDFPLPDPIKRYEEALAAYFARDFSRAVALLDGCDDGPGRTLRARCREMAERPPPPEWNGVWTLHTK